MRGPSRSPNPLPPRSVLVAVAASALLAGACVGSSPSLAPSASPTASTEPTPTTSSPVAPPSPTPTPSASPVVLAGPWVAAGEMVGVPSVAMAVQIADGRVLVLDGEGGPDDEEGRPAAQIWDPATGGWATTTGLDQVRTEFALVALDDGRALIAGGLNEGDWWTGQSYSSTYAFDPRPGHEDWTKVGLMHQARTAPTAIRLDDGRILVAGGYFNTGVTEAAAPAPEADPGIVLAGYRPAGPGGTGPTQPPLDDVEMPQHGYALATAEVFDPASGTWSRTGAMRYARVGARAVGLADGRVLVVGSQGDGIVGIHPDAYVTAEVYDPATGRFSLAGRLPAIDHDAVAKLGVDLPDDEGQPGGIGTLVAEPDGSALLMGYERWWKHTADIVRDFRFDPDTGVWAVVGQLCASARSDISDEWDVTPGDCRDRELTVGLADGDVLAIGSPPWTDEGVPIDPTGRVRLLDAATVTWSEVEPVPVGRQGGAAIALADGSVLVLGGIADGEYATLAVRWVP